MHIYIKHIVKYKLLGLNKLLDQLDNGYCQFQAISIEFEVTKQYINNIISIDSKADEQREQTVQ